MKIRVATADPAGWFVTAWEDDRQVGFLKMHPREYTYQREPLIRYAEVVELVVVETERRRGVGSELLRTAMNLAAVAGFERLAVESTAREDRPGPGFYRAQGFTARSTIWDVEL